MSQDGAVGVLQKNLKWIIGIAGLIFGYAVLHTTVNIMSEDTKIVRAEVAALKEFKAEQRVINSSVEKGLSEISLKLDSIDKFLRGRIYRNE